MSGYSVTRTYAYPVQEVWEVLTAPDWVGRWTTTGRGGRPEGFAPVPGTSFRFVGKPTLGWAGVVYCEVEEVDAPRLLRYTWRGEPQGSPSQVTYRLEPVVGGTRLTWRHTGFSGIGGFAMAQLLGAVRRKMLTDGLPPVLAAHSADSALN
jgi:uncharacterized protein YndB with AHSA1/START domain